MQTESGNTRSIWMAAQDVPEGTPLDASASADVCVIGAGLAGISTAYFLAREGARVIVLEAAGSIGCGETGRTTAHLSSALDDRYFVLEKAFGLEGARLAAESHSAAIDRIEAIVNAEGIDCAYTRLDGFLFLGRQDTEDTLRRELAAAARAGLGVQLLAESPVAGLTGPALRFMRQAQFHPLRYLAGLARAVLQAGGRICTHTRVVNVRDGEPARVETASGHVVTAHSVVVATNTPISDRISIHTKQAPYRTYAIALPIERGTIPTALYWDTEDPYHYIRTFADADGNEVLIVGGEDHKTGQRDPKADPFEALERWTREHFPASGDVRDRWSGQVMEPADHLAYIGRDLHVKHVYIATGDSGHGMTHSTLAGMLLTDLIVGRENPWEELYAPGRKPARALGTYVEENLNVASQFRDYVTSGDVDDVRAIAPRSGAIVRQGARKLAVYRDEGGALHAHSAMCTHVGCLVHWNAIEGSWDCPCHGSRFSPEGAVISGPARSPLAAAELTADPGPRNPRPPLGDKEQRK